ncbi:hypothetical protein [Archangium lansingense]|uniref:Uncharacterized protein n=1 Tax=Archangium lansingense TaxID=2995310 RepID=A0ABT4A5X6_9BACT|nr:hypothetical protein [Archangium lansinium]MCY1077053.1 hypothetical protein [Archangium lansinium]
MRQTLEKLRARPLPPELVVPTPRPDVWGEKGYLSQPRYQALYKPLLLEGYATWGLVYQYESIHDGEGPDTVASYAWLDDRGELQTRPLKEIYDGMHAALSQGLGDIILDMDARLEADKVILILHDLTSGEHILYEALHAAPVSGGTKDT